MKNDLISKYRTLFCIVLVISLDKGGINIRFKVGGGSIKILYIVYNKKIFLLALAGP